jgi:hypothetical protein
LPAPEWTIFRGETTTSFARDPSFFATGRIRLRFCGSGGGFPHGPWITASA